MVAAIVVVAGSEVVLNISREPFFLLLFRWGRSSLGWLECRRPGGCLRHLYSCCHQACTWRASLNVRKLGHLITYVLASHY